MIVIPGIKIFALVAAGLLYSFVTTGQVPVSKEPRHKPVFVNKYVRLLDVWLQPGDTTFFHVHATPSVFVVLSTTFTSSQIKGEDWVSGISEAGTSWYRSFTPDTLVHRVYNADTVVYHVNDIEILSKFNAGKISLVQDLPFNLLFDNENVAAWRLTDHSADKKIINTPVPMIAELVSGEGVTIFNTKTKQSAGINKGKYHYIEPGSSFYLKTGSSDKIDLVLFAIK